ANPASCSPALRTIWVGFFGSGRSLSALPENSLASSSGVGLLGSAYFQESFTIGSGYAPPWVWYKARIRTASSPMICRSVRALAGGSAPFQCHCNQREEVVREPFSSAKHDVGRRKTSVWIFAGSTSLCSP